MREEDLSDRLGELMKGIHVPGAIAKKIVDSLQTDAKRSNAERLRQILGLRQQLATIRTRMDQIYEDKLDGATDGVSLWPAYRRPFDLIFQHAKTEDWSALADDFRTFLLNPDIFELTLSAV